MKRNHLHIGLLACLLFIFFTVPARAQQNDDRLLARMDSVEISLITCGPGQEIYSLYGHTALRYREPSHGVDLAVNWGIFNSRIPHFALRFALGLTDYQMDMEPFDAFMMNYARQGRWMLSQRLNLTREEKLAISEAVNDNYLPQNRVYRYNYFYDNCTTRARDMVLSHVNGKVDYAGSKTWESTYRKEIHQWNADSRWARLGNDLLLGFQSDKQIGREEQQFVPDSLRKDFDRIVIVNGSSRRALVDSTFYILRPVQLPAETGFPLSPLACAALLLTIVIIFTLMEQLRGWNIRALDILLSAASGIAGLLLLMMVFSEHPTVRMNLQILIFNPVVLVWQLVLLCRKGSWRGCWKFQAICIVLFLLGNIFQNYAEGMNLVALCLLLRSMAHLRKGRQTVNNEAKK